MNSVMKVKGNVNRKNEYYHLIPIGNKVHIITTVHAESGTACICEDVETGRVQIIYREDLEEI